MQQEFSSFPLKKGFGGPQDEIFAEWIPDVPRICDVQPTTRTAFPHFPEAWNSTERLFFPK